ncbi:unnamed protein product, partial [Iphiclides podalirius]
MYDSAVVWPKVTRRRRWCGLRRNAFARIFTWQSCWSWYEVTSWLTYSQTSPGAVQAAGLAACRIMPSPDADATRGAIALWDARAPHRGPVNGRRASPAAPTTAAARYQTSCTAPPRWCRKCTAAREPNAPALALIKCTAEIQAEVDYTRAESQARPVD